MGREMRRGGLLREMVGVRYMIGRTTRCGRVIIIHYYSFHHDMMVPNKV